jgi:hypothetical protein
MSPRLRPEKLHIIFKDGYEPQAPINPRCYTLTHSDRTGDLFLTIGAEVDRTQISGLYTRLMRDEVVACWEFESGKATLHVQLHVSGGLVLGKAGWRDSIFRHHLGQVLEAFRYGDRELYRRCPELDTAHIVVHFNSSNPEYNRSEKWGSPCDYLVTAQ